MTGDLSASQQSRAPHGLSRSSIDIAVTAADQIDAVRQELKAFAASRPAVSVLASFAGKLSTPSVLSELRQRATTYLGSFEYHPIERQISDDLGRRTLTSAPLTFSADPGALDEAINAALRLATNPTFGKEIIERVLLHPPVLGKVACILEHGFMLKAITGADRESLAISLCSCYAQDDAALRFVRKVLPEEESCIRDSPALYTRIAIAHRWACRVHHVDPYDTERQALLGSGSNPIAHELVGFLRPDAPRHSVMHMISNLRAGAAVPCDTKLIVGESLFFQPSPDAATFDLSQHLFDCFERGVRNVEVPTDLLPFDPSKRLPAEIADDELSRICELARALGQTITIHSPLVGPLHQKTGFNALLEDPADNPKLLRETIDLAERLGAKTVVVHLSNRQCDEAVGRYADMVMHASGKDATDGTPLRIAFENYMHKKLPELGKPFPTMSEHFACYWQVLEQVLVRTIQSAQDPAKALRHCALLLDSAHFNLVSDFDEDPVKAVMDLANLGPRAARSLLSHPEAGEPLRRAGFDPTSFCEHMVVQLHLNQNIGPIGFTIPGVDFNADLHLPVESSGTIDNLAFVTLLRDAGFGGATEHQEVDLVILAEQRRKLEPAGLKTLYDAARDEPAVDIPHGFERVKHYIKQGRSACARYSSADPDGYQRLENLLCDQTGMIRDHYAYTAGRLGIRHLIDHLKRRASHHLLSAHVDTGARTKLESLPHLDASIRSFSEGEVIVQKGVSYQAAKAKGENVFFLLLSGTADVSTGSGTITLTPGTPFGEIMFLSGAPRSATVLAGSGGAQVLQIPEEAFWDMFKLFRPLQERLQALLERRVK